MLSNKKRLAAWDAGLHAKIAQDRAEKRAPRRHCGCAHCLEQLRYTLNVLQALLSVVDDNRKVVGILSVVGATTLSKFGQNFARFQCQMNRHVVYSHLPRTHQMTAKSQRSEELAKVQTTVHICVEHPKSALRQRTRQILQLFEKIEKPVS